MIRPAADSASDYQAFARLFPLMQLPDATPSQAYWDQALRQDTLLLEEGGAILGFAIANVFGPTGFVMNVVVDGAARGRGLGRALMTAVAARLRERGCTRWELSVRTDNHPALALYRTVGMAVVHESRTFSTSWSIVDALPAAAVTVSPISVDADADLERQWDFMDGKLARSRRIGALLLRADDAEGCVGFARFLRDPPRSFPFRVARVDVVRPLLEAMRREAPDTAQLRIISDDAAVSELLQQRGAELEQELVRMRGAL
jgi:GNAT superfamily N-acetyltransferase